METEIVDEMKRKKYSIKLVLVKIIVKVKTLCRLKV